MRIKKFNSFNLNESAITADVEEIRDDIEFRLMDLGESIDLNVTDLIFRIGNITSADLNDLTYCVSWIISYSSGNGYDIELTAGNYLSFGGIGFYIPNCSNIEELDGVSQIELIRDYITEFYEGCLKLSEDKVTGCFLKLSLKKRL